jgi:hypothetical protein
MLVTEHHYVIKWFIGASSDSRSRRFDNLLVESGMWMPV